MQNIYEGLKEIAKEYHAEYSFDEVLAPYTTMKIGGPCDFMVKPNSESCLLALIRRCHQDNIPYYILGKGSNVLISSKGLRKAIFVIGKAMSAITVEATKITAEAGASLKSFCVAALAHDLTGLEFAYGIPGTVGGALFMNAGAYGGEMKDVVVSCRCICGDEICEMPLSQMELGYRTSYFSKNNCCITSITVELQPGDHDKIEARMNELMGRRIDKQPLNYPSAGSTFKRPVGDFASRLIEVCGLKGTASGGAEVSTKHSGFVINKDNATFEDVLDVVDIVKKCVYEKTGTQLECEMLILE